MRARSGTTIAELMVAIFILGLLFVALFEIYRMGASAWRKGEAETTLLQGLQVVKSRLDRELERSTFDSLSVDANGLAFLSAMDYGTRSFVIEPALVRPRWQKYIVVYYDPPQRAILWREVPVVGTPQENGATPIEAFGAQTPLASYYAGGRVVIRDVAAWQIQVTVDELVALTWRVERQRYGKQAPETIELRSVVHMRNR